MDIYEQLKEKFIMKNACEDWAGYREAFTKLIVGEGEALRDRSIAVIGAGRCNDIDIKWLAEYFDRIILIDTDEAAMSYGIARLSDDVKSKIQPGVLSLNGIYEKDIDDFCNKLLSFVRSRGRNISEEMYGDFLGDLIGDLKSRIVRSKELEAKLSENSFDVIVCNGVFSQLFSMHSFFIRSVSQSIRDGLSIDVSRANEKAEQMLSEINGFLIPDINRVLVSAAKDRIIFGNEFSRNKKTEGAYQCIEDIRKKYKPDEKELTWNFNKGEAIRYNMLIQTIKKGTE